MIVGLKRMSNGSQHFQQQQQQQQPVATTWGNTEKPTDEQRHSLKGATIFEKRQDVAKTCYHELPIGAYIEVLT